MGFELGGAGPQRCFGFLRLAASWRSPDGSVGLCACNRFGLTKSSRCSPSVSCSRFLQSQVSEKPSLRVVGIAEEVCLRLSDSGVLRSYTDCYRTPVANTAGPGFPIIGMI